MNRIYRHCLVIACTMMLSGCGMIDYAYKKAPDYVASEFDEAFDLSESQIGQLDSRLDQFFTWHRQQELGRYQRLLERAALSAVDGITAAEFLDLKNEVRLAWQRSLEKAIEDLGDLAVTLDPQQIENYQRYHRDSNEEYEDYLQKSDQQREIYRVRRSIDRLENWFGNFTRDQEEKISARLQRLPDFYEPWIVYREARQQALVNAFTNATDAGLTREQLKTILLDPSTDYARRFEPALQSYWRAYAAALEDISPWLTQPQKQRVVDKLRKYARIAARLTDAG
ncbi:MAG: hypothetical protein KJN95_01310 [Gammaproteobacteria bacterium]|nr:hypothetical protein [Gammaproteobacteria bacterium]